MTNDLPVFPIINIDGSAHWRRSYEQAEAWDQRFPGQCADDLAYAICYNGCPDGFDALALTGLRLTQQGERDEGEWHWEVDLSDGSTWIAVGWCDYTGWDCRSGLGWSKLTEVF